MEKYLGALTPYGPRPAPQPVLHGQPRTCMGRGSHRHSAGQQSRPTGSSLIEWHSPHLNTSPRGCHILAFPSYLPLLGFALQGPHHCRHINILKGRGKTGAVRAAQGQKKMPISIRGSNSHLGQPTPNHGNARGLPHCRSGAKPPTHCWGEAEPQDFQGVIPYHIILSAVITDV